MNVLKHVCELNYDNVEALLARFRRVDTNNTGRIQYEQFLQVLETDETSRFAEILFNLLHPDEGKPLLSYSIHIYNMLIYMYVCMDLYILCELQHIRRSNQFQRSLLWSLSPNER